MPSIETAVQWAIAIANDDTHGYDQGNRYGPDYDCSSFVSIALQQGGFNISAYNTTYTLYNVLTNLGFEVVSGARQRGDIFLKTNAHVVMCIDDTQIVHASINENGGITGGQTGDQTGKEICITNWWDYGWNYHLRYTGEDSGGGYDEPIITAKDWIGKNEYLTLDEMKNNALLIARIFLRKKWSLQAIAAMLGNMQVESTINPLIWQDLNNSDPSGGFGLVQWTPSSNVTDWLYENLYDVTNADEAGIGECNRIQYELENGLQWIITDEFPMSFEEFSKSKATPTYLANAFLYNYERPAELDQPARGVNAEYWYGFLMTQLGIKEKKKGFNFILFGSRKGRKQWIN